MYRHREASLPVGNALDAASRRCASFYGGLEALAQRVRPHPAGSVREELLDEEEWEAFDALGEAAYRASEAGEHVDDAVWRLLDAAGYEEEGSA